MKQSLWLVGVYGLILACGAGTAAAARAGAGASAAAGAGAAKAPATQPGVTETLADGSVEFVRPADWEEAKRNRTPLRAAWVSPKPDRKGMILVEVWPDGEITESTGPKTVSKLRVDRRKQPGVQVVVEAELEKDPRFAMRIREKYQHNADGTVEDVLRLARKVGGRVVMVTVWSKSPEDARDKEIHAAGEAVMLSAKPAKK